MTRQIFLAQKHEVPTFNDLLVVSLPGEPSSMLDNLVKPAREAVLQLPLDFRRRMITIPADEEMEMFAIGANREEVQTKKSCGRDALFNK